MRFDDRLSTALKLVADDPVALATRWRQLVDLLAHEKTDLESPRSVRALEVIRVDAPQVPEHVRIAAADALSGLPFSVPTKLLECLHLKRRSAPKPPVRAAVLEGLQCQHLATIAAPDSLDITNPSGDDDKECSSVDDSIARLLGARSDQGTAVLSIVTEYAHDQVSSSSEKHAEPERHRDHGGVEPLLSYGRPGREPAHPSMFRWECEPNGEIVWVDCKPRGAFIGLSIRNKRGAGHREAPYRASHAISRGAPFRDHIVTLTGDGPTSGEWKFSGMPVFTRNSGQLAGYRGVAGR